LKRGTLIRLLVGIACSLAALFLLGRTLDPGRVVATLEKGNPLVVAAAAAIYFVELAVRAVRWDVLMGRYRVGIGLLFRSLVIGFTINDLLPLRLGEIARIYTLNRRAGVPTGISFASVIAERVLDGLVVTGFLVLGLLLVPGDDALRFIAIVASVLFAGLTVGLFAAAFAPAPFRAIGYAFARVLPGHWKERVIRLVDSTLDGLGALANWSTIVRATALSVGVWMIEAAIYRLLMTGFGIGGGWIQALMTTGAGNLATLAPSGPGYIGTYDLAVEQTLSGAFGVDPTAAATFAVVIHLTVLVPVVLVGLVLISQEGTSLRGLSQVPAPFDQASASLPTGPQPDQALVGASKDTESR
jgi:uncharacterized protein (TIRG00374 family)